MAACAALTAVRDDTARFGCGSMLSLRLLPVDAAGVVVPVLDPPSAVPGLLLTREPRAAVGLLAPSSNDASGVGIAMELRRRPGRSVTVAVLALDVALPRDTCRLPLARTLDATDEASESGVPPGVMYRDARGSPDLAPGVARFAPMADCGMPMLERAAPFLGRIRLELSLLRSTRSPGVDGTVDAGLERLNSRPRGDGTPPGERMPLALRNGDGVVAVSGLKLCPVGVSCMLVEPFQRGRVGRAGSAMLSFLETLRASGGGW
jgi:hypothetical protein